MAKKTRTEITPEQWKVIKKVGAELKKMRNEKYSSVEKFCMDNKIPRITYGNLENGKSSFQISTLMNVLDVYGMDLSTFFNRL